MTEEQARMSSLIENVQRNDLSPIGEARVYPDLLAGGMTQAALGEQIGKSQGYIATMLGMGHEGLCVIVKEAQDIGQDDINAGEHIKMI